MKKNFDENFDCSPAVERSQSRAISRVISQPPVCSPVVERSQSRAISRVISQVPVCSPAVERSQSRAMHGGRSPHPHARTHRWWCNVCTLRSSTICAHDLRTRFYAHEHVHALYGRARSRSLSFKRSAPLFRRARLALASRSVLRLATPARAWRAHAVLRMQRSAHARTQCSASPKLTCPCARS